MSWQHGDGNERREEHTAEIERPPQSGPWLLEVGTETGSSFHQLADGASLLIGSASDADLRLRDRHVSARHARVRATSSGVEVEDLGSRNGVYVGAARVHSARLEGSGSGFVVGHCSITLRRQDEGSSARCRPIPGLVGNSAPMRALTQAIRRHAPHRAPILLQGESGSGKDVVARCLHQLSGRRGAYVPLNVGTIPESLADAELFGHVRGAFTGAVSAQPGAFKSAHGGTLFLDEIADLPASVQVKLLRIVEDGRLRALGASAYSEVDVRLVSASWASLAELAERGRFRADLFHRISTVVLDVPPLRQRRSDIPALAEVLLARVRPEVGPRRLDGAALAQLVAYRWPGNVRELSSVLYRAAVAAEGSLIEARHVAAALPSGVRRAVRPKPADPEALLRANDGNVSAAARAAGMARSTFRSWLKRSRSSA